MFSKNLFGERVREQRLKHNEVQEDLAKILDVRISHVSEIERGNRTTSPERIVILCKHFKVSSDYLLGLTDNPKPRK